MEPSAKERSREREGGGGQESARRSSHAGSGVTEQSKRARSVRRKSSSQLLARTARRARERVGAGGESERCGAERGIE